MELSKGDQRAQTSGRITENSLPESDESELGVIINALLTIGSIMFADDTTLIANSVEKCKKLLAITDTE